MEPRHRKRLLCDPLIEFGDLAVEEVDVAQAACDGLGLLTGQLRGRQLGQGLFEFRVDRTVKPDDEIAEKLVLRVFCHAYGDRKILVLHGYDKGKSPSSRRQQREIEVARSRLAAWRAIEAEQRKKPLRKR